VIWRRWVSISCHMIHIYRLGHLMIRILLLGLGMQTQRTVWNRENKAASVYKREITSWQGVCGKWMRKKQKIEKRTTDFIKRRTGKEGLLGKEQYFKDWRRERDKERKRETWKKKEGMEEKKHKEEQRRDTDRLKQKEEDREGTEEHFILHSFFLRLFPPLLPVSLFLSFSQALYMYI